MQYEKKKNKNKHEMSFILNFTIVTGMIQTLSDVETKPHTKKERKW